MATVCVGNAGEDFTEGGRTMRIAYFDCFSGISGDMTLGALVDVGVDMAVLQAELAKLPVTGYRLERRVVKRGGLRGTKVDVLVEAAQPARKYTDIVAMISESDLSPAIRQNALDNAPGAPVAPTGRRGRGHWAAGPGGGCSHGISREHGVGHGAYGSWAAPSASASDSGAAQGVPLLCQ